MPFSIFIVLCLKSKEIDLFSGMQNKDVDESYNQITTLKQKDYAERLRQNFYK